ncbi:MULTISPECIES: DUF418 domain-containing protein [Sphingomonas]|uniref:DUF418 domain-containing protein n=1 Tax=Sphingomonas TaxID=13687 RepID=UPI000DEFC039|nr:MULTISPECIES: DUF418 domain-containing protein [Sphingomonas]
MSSVAAPADRIATLDLIRGVAVMGIFSVNVVAFAMIEGAYFNPGAYGGHTGADLWLWAVNLVLIDGKMRSLFSMLFGASMLLVIDRAEASGQNAAAVHFRRMLVLMGFGLVHFYFIWFGDILFSYGAMGVIAFFFRNRSARQLGWIGGGLIIANMILFAAFTLHLREADLLAHSARATADQIADWNQIGRLLYPLPTDFVKDLAVYRGGFVGRLTQMVSERGGEPFGSLPFIGPETLGLMLLGMACFKSGLFTGVWSDAAYRKIAWVGLVVGAIVFTALAWADVQTRFYVPVVFGGFLMLAPFRVQMALGYAALIILLGRRMGPLAQWIAAAGRCAFSNYLGTSIVASFVFYGWGLGLYGSVSRFEAWLLAPVLWLVMLTWSKPWLERFHYGPLEWLWRSLSRGSLQPMRKGKRAPAVAGA